MAFYRNSVRPDNTKGVLDFVRGSDFWANKSANGTRLDKQEAQPIFEDLAEDPHKDSRIQKILEQCRTPRIQIPTDLELKKFADLLYEDLVNPRGGRSRGRSAGRGDYQDSAPARGQEGGDYPDQAPARSSDNVRRPAPATSRRPAVQEEAALDSTDDVPGLEPAPRRTSTAPAAGRPSTAPATSRPSTAPATSRPSTAPAAGRPSAQTPSRPVAAGRPGARGGQPLPPEEAGEGGRIEDDPAELPEEDKDLVPPAEGDGLDDTAPASPPPVSRGGGAATPASATDIRSRLAARRPQQPGR
jgi:hypothetical protein